MCCVVTYTEVVLSFSMLSQHCSVVGLEGGMAASRPLHADDQWFLDIVSRALLGNELLPLDTSFRLCGGSHRPLDPPLAATAAVCAAAGEDTCRLPARRGARIVSWAVGCLTMVQAILHKVVESRTTMATEDRRGGAAWCRGFSPWW